MSNLLCKFAPLAKTSFRAVIHENQSLYGEAKLHLLMIFGRIVLTSTLRETLHNELCRALTHGNDEKQGVIMGMSLKDLSRTVEILNARREARSQEKAEAFADKIMSNGLWFILTIPVAIMLIGLIGALVGMFILPGDGALNMFIKLCIGFVGARIWYKSTFTKCHPFVSSMAVLVAMSALVVILDN